MVYQGLLLGSLFKNAVLDIDDALVLVMDVVLKQIDVISNLFLLLFFFALHLVKLLLLEVPLVDLIDIGNCPWLPLSASISWFPRCFQGTD